MTAVARRKALVLALAALAPCFGHAQGQAYPSKTITIVVPFPPGGPNDILAREIAQRLGPALKQTIIVENRSGATGNIGAQAVARAPADGHTLLLTLDTALIANPEIYGKRMGYDPERELRPVSGLAYFSQMLVVSPSTGITGFKQFVEAAKKGLMNYVSAGNASPGHLTMEALQQLVGGQLNHVPYRGNAPAVLDLLGGQVQAGFVATPSVAQHAASGKLTALAVSGSKRSPLAPNVPTIAELGYPAATTEFGYVLLAPAATPDAVVQQLNTEVRKALAADGLPGKLRALDIEPTGTTPQQAAADLKRGVNAGPRSSRNAASRLSNEHYWFDQDRALIRVIGGAPVRCRWDAARDSAWPTGSTPSSSPAAPSLRRVAPTAGPGSTASDPLRCTNRSNRWRLRVVGWWAISRQCRRRLPTSCAGTRFRYLPLAPTSLTVWSPWRATATHTPRLAARAMSMPRTAR